MDESLGRRIASGEEDALTQCYQELGPAVRAYLRRYVGPDEADDVLQTTFLEVWRCSSRYDPERSLSTWVFTIARRRAIDALRKRREDVVPVESLQGLLGEDGRETAERFAWAASVRSALALLPDEQREALLLAYFAGQTQREISASLDTPLGTVKARMARGVKALALHLARAEEQDRANRGDRA